MLPLSDILAVLRRRASSGQVTAYHILNDNNLYAEKRGDPYVASGRPFAWFEKPADLTQLMYDIKLRADSGDAIASDILSEIGDK